jgi:hypothetical protein
MSQSNRNKPGCGCLALMGVGASVAIVGTVGAFLYFRGFFGKALVPSEAAQIIPQEALMTSYISTDPQDWEKLSQYGTAEAQKLLTENLQNAQKEIFKPEDNINYEQDIEPWLGGVMLAFLPNSTTTTGRVTQPTDSENFLVVVGIKNKLKALEFANKVKKESKNQKSVETNYQGITIVETTDSNNEKYSWSFFKNYIVFAPTKETIEQVIDTSKGKPSLAQKTGANNVFSQKLTVKNPIATIYIPDYGTAAEQLITSAMGDAPIPSTTLQQLQQVEGVALGVGLEEQGIHMQAIAKLNPNISQPTLTPAKGQVLSQFPANTLALVSGQGIKQTWEQAVAQSQSDPELQNAIALVRQSLQSSGFDADREIFGWMDGEFALGAIDTGPVNLTINDPGLGGVMILETSDRQTGQQTIEKLQNQVTSNPYAGIAIEQKNIQGTDVTQWTAPGVGTFLSYGWLNNNSLLVSVKVPFENLLSLQPSTALNQSPTFKTVTASLPQSNLGYFYVDLEKLTAKINSFSQVPGSTMPLETSAMLNSMQGLAFTVTMPDATTSQMDMMLSLKTTTTQRVE